METTSLSLACLTTLVSDAVDRELELMRSPITRTVVRQVSAKLRKRQALLRRLPSERGPRPAPRTFEEADLFTDSEVTSTDSEEPESEPTEPEKTVSTAGTRPRSNRNSEASEYEGTHQDSLYSEPEGLELETLLDGRPPNPSAPSARSSQYSTDVSVWVAGSSAASSNESVQMLGTNWPAAFFRKRRRLEQR